MADPTWPSSHSHLSSLICHLSCSRLVVLSHTALSYTAQRQAHTLFLSTVRVAESDPKPVPVPVSAPVLLPVPLPAPLLIPLPVLLPVPLLIPLPVPESSATVQLS